MRTIHNCTTESIWNRERNTSPTKKSIKGITSRRSEPRPIANGGKSGVGGREASVEDLTAEVVGHDV